MWGLNSKKRGITSFEIKGSYLFLVPAVLSQSKVPLAKLTVANQLKNVPSV
jgi:hypothetical protein